MKYNYHLYLEVIFLKINNKAILIIPPFLFLGKDK